MDKILESVLPIVLMATKAQQEAAADAAADAAIAAIQHTETKLDNIVAKDAISLLRRMCDRIETQI